MRLPPADLVDAMQPFRAVVLRKRPELWDMAPSGIHDAARFIARAISQPAGEDETTVALLLRLTAALEAEPNPKGRSPVPESGSPRRWAKS